jgi:type I restriction-modification system DNA methylase subunit
MIAHATQNWRKEFGLDKRKPHSFFSNTDDLSPGVPQAHVLRKAFDLLKLDGILCTENSPLIYFKQVNNITPDQVLKLHRQFWNHGGAPVLVLISDKFVNIYSGMSRPVLEHKAQENPPSLVKTLDRVSQGLQEFLASVESGKFFQQHAKSFNPNHRVDRDLLDNLKDTREVLDEITQRDIAPHVLDALLCRMVFACYLFDRGVINENYLQKAGIKNASHLRDVLAIQPTGDAKEALYNLFQKLGKDFNGDLFSDNLDAEAKKITNKHIQALNDFFHGTLVRSGQQSFWPYDFSAIPVETISAIYEHFLKAGDHQAGAFYTPRFLAEVVLDIALENFGSLIGKKFLDPACGSGIFLVGLFMRIAEEWKQANPKARNDRRGRELLELMRSSLFGIDINLTACRITAFSLYLAYLDQLTPRDIQELQAKGRALPHLVFDPQANDGKTNRGNIYCADFFTKNKDIPADVDLVIGNPPWGGIATNKEPSGQWCKANEKTIPDNQIAAAFSWKAAEHVNDSGKICFILPHGLLFNHSTTAISYQKQWMSQNKIERVFNLSDFRWFLFNRAVYPAIVVSYQKGKPAPDHQIDYWAPKADWTSTQAEVITVSPIDRSSVSLKEVLQDLDSQDAPQIWKQKFWASPRDARLLDRLSLYPRLRDYVRNTRETDEKKPWVMAEGFQPVTKNDDPDKAKLIKLPSKKFLEAKASNIDLFILPDDCTDLEKSSVLVRGRSNKNTAVFHAPHVLVSAGFTSVAFADFDVAFQDSLRGIHGPKSDTDLLAFLTAYLRSPLAKYYLFHTSSSWGIARPLVTVQELMRLPMLFPELQSDPKRCREIVKKVSKIIKGTADQARGCFMDRSGIIAHATAKIEPLIYEYFDIQPLERLLIEDTLNIILPSIQPNHKRMPVPTVKASTADQREAYVGRVCEMLNMWSKNGPSIVRGKTFADDKLGLGMAVLEKISRSEAKFPMNGVEENVLQSLDRLRNAVSQQRGTINPVRGLMVFDQNRLFIAKPIAQRHWMQTAALNDADEIAGTLLMHSYKERA